MIKVQFNKETGFLETYWFGTIDLQEILNYMSGLKEYRAHVNRLKILSSADDLHVLLSPSDIKEIADQNRKSEQNYEVIFDAFVVNDTYVAALSLLYEQFSRMKGYSFKVFSTREAAIAWLLIK